MAGQERLVAFALPFQGLQLAGDIDLSVSVVKADIQRNDSDGVAGDQESIFFCVIECKCENPVQFLQEIRSLVAVQGENDLTIAARTEIIFPGVAAADLLMVVDLAVHCQHLLPVRGEERLSAGLRVHDAQALVGHDGAPAAPDAAPVRPPVPKFAAHPESLPAHGVGLFANVENAGYSTHDLAVLL